MKLRNITRRIKTTPKKFVALFAFLLILAIPMVVLAGFGPERPTYDYNKYDPSKSCTDPSQAFGRCGSMDGPVFNSFVNTPTYGDERNFTRIAEVVPNQSPVEADFRESSTAVAGKTYWVRTFVHNDANQNLNGTNNDGISVAKDVKVRVAIDGSTVNGLDIASYVTSSNAKQTSVFDTATLTNTSQAFSTSYVNGSAVLYNQAHQGGVALPDTITSATGTPIGYQDMNGTLPGCFDFSAYVYVKVQVKAPAISLSKEVRMKGENSQQWRQQLEAKSGDHVEYLLDYKNTGTSVDNNIVIRDELPSNLELVPGTVKWIDENRPNGTPIPDSFLFAKAGVALGNYGVNGGGYVMFEATVKNDNKECVAKNVGFIYADNVPETNDDAVVTIKDCKPVTPVVSCDVLTAESLGDHTFRFTVKYTAQNATFKQASFNFGDGSAPFLTNNTSNNSVTAEHKYATDGTFTAKATLTFMVDGKEQVVNSSACATPVSTTTPPEHCPLPGKENLPKDSPECKVTPVTPTELPNTGPGGVAAVFAAVSVGGAMAYRVFTARRLGE